MPMRKNLHWATRPEMCWEMRPAGMERRDHMQTHVEDTKVAEIEALAIELAREAGLILGRHFGSQLEVEYKDEEHHDPVTIADKECQEFLAGRISKHFPDHGFLGEEGGEPGDRIAPDFVWVVDPLDGTKNFMSGLPVFASSIGVLYRGAPIVGALYLPWPAKGGGVVMHARRGGGAFVEGEPVTVFGGDEPESIKLVTLPASFAGAFRLGKSMRGKVGEIRVTGSISYEMAMTARGVLQYSIATTPRLWDVAGGAALVIEAGGVVMVGRMVARRWVLGAAQMHWEPHESLMPSWQSGTTTLKDMWRWSAPLVLGGPQVARYVTRSLSSRWPLRHRLTRAMRRLKRQGRPQG